MSSRLVAVFGRPSACLRSLLDSLRGEGIAVVVGSDVRRFVETADVAATQAFHSFTRAGKLVPADVWAELLMLASPHHPTVLAGMLRNGADLTSFHRQAGRPLTLFYVDVSVAQVDAERAAMGMPPVEIGHPGASDRWDAMLQEMAQTAQQLSVPFVVVPGVPCSPALLSARIRELLA